VRGPRPRVQHIPRNFDAALGEIMTVKNTQGRKTPAEDDVFTFEWKESVRAPEVWKLADGPVSPGA